MSELKVFSQKKNLKNLLLVKECHIKLHNVDPILQKHSILSLVLPNQNKPCLPYKYGSRSKNYPPYSYVPINIQSHDLIDKWGNGKYYTSIVSSQELVYFCEMCFKPFTSYRILKEHTKATYQAKLFTNVCDELKEYMSKSSIDCVAKDERFQKIVDDCTCQICHKDFEWPSKLKRHYESVHLGLKPYDCHICLERFSSKLGLKGHISSTHQKLKPYKCPICPTHAQKAFAFKASLRNHVTASHRDQLNAFSHFDDSSKAMSVEYLPTVGNWSQRRIGTKKRRRATEFITVGEDIRVHLKVFKCRLCDREFNQSGHLTRHIKLIHGVYECHLCKEQNDDITPTPDTTQKLFRSKNCLNNHIRQHHTEPNRHEPPLDITSPDHSESELIQDHPNTFWLKADGSGISSNLRLPLPPDTPLELVSMISSQLSDGSQNVNVDEVNSLLENEQNGVTIAPRPTFLCETCKESFGDRTSLVRHVRHFHEEKSYLCYICGRAYYQKPHLNRHLASTVHADVLPHQCNSCGKRFAHPMQLQKHLVDLFFHQDPTLLSAPKFMCHVCTPTQAFLLPRGVRATIYEAPLSQSSIDLEASRIIDKIGLDTSILSLHGDNEALLSSLALNLDREDANQTTYPLIAFDPSTVRKDDRAGAFIRIVRFPNAKELQVHMAQLHPGVEIVENTSEYHSRLMVQTYVSRLMTSQQPALTSVPELGPASEELQNYNPYPGGQRQVSSDNISHYDNNLNQQPYTLNNPTTSSSLPNEQFDCQTVLEDESKASFSFLHLCEYCGKTFTYGKTLKEHTKKMHASAQEKPEFDNASYLVTIGTSDANDVYPCFDIQPSYLENSVSSAHTSLRRKGRRL